MNSDRDQDHLFVDLSVSRGPLKYGAVGFLYGLGNDDIPSLNMLAPLKAQVAAQKPEGGQQHPNGDALNVSNTYKAAGGREIEIYIQDSYSNWPYEELGMEDLLNKVELVMQQVMESPNRAMFSYVPFNEPDQIWYNKTDKKQKFFEDWKTVVWKIKSIDPSARVVGPNFARYDRGVYKDFLSFAKENDCLPEVISWHELNDDFFPGWYERYDDYRGIESSLGIAAREICINEYCRITGDLSIPGKLIQWVTRFENSKVDACLAYWTDAGSLNNLVTPDNYNKATGGWWLYRWYSEMTGSTVNVTPPDRNAEGLQGLAALDGARKEARILVGGGSKPVQIVVTGFHSAPYFGKMVHVSAWEALSTGVLPSEGPVLIQEGDYPVMDDQVTIPLGPAADSSAYQLILTPAENQPTAYPLNSTFVVTAAQNGYYNTRVMCSARLWDGEFGIWKIEMKLNGAHLKDITIPAAGPGISTILDIQVFLVAGINWFTFNPAASGEEEAVSIQSVTITPSSQPVNAYEAEAPTNTLSGTAAVMEDDAASNCKFVGEIGNGEENALTFNNIYVSTGGVYRMIVSFANAEFRGGHSYNSQVVDRYAEISVNGAAPQKVYFRNTFDWHNYQSRAVDVTLKAGNNTISFSNRTPCAYAPHIDRIEIAGPTMD